MRKNKAALMPRYKSFALQTAMVITTTKSCRKNASSDKPKFSNDIFLLPSRAAPTPVYIFQNAMSL